MMIINAMPKTWKICSTCKDIYVVEDNQAGCPKCLEAKRREVRNNKYEKALAAIAQTLSNASSVGEAFDSTCQIIESMGFCLDESLKHHKESPVDYSDHKYFDDCHYCKFGGLQDDDEPCGICCNLTNDKTVLSSLWEPFGQQSDNSSYYEKARGAAKPSGAQLSRDDQNRRLRESRLGFSEPSADWENAGEVTVCLYDGQHWHRNGSEKTVEDLGIKQIHIYNQNSRIRF